MPLISVIVAVAQNNAVGLNGRLPWKLPIEMQWFKRCIKDKAIIMGKNTFEGIGHPIANCKNIVTSNSLANGNNFNVVNSLDKALQISCADINEKTPIFTTVDELLLLPQVFVIGGMQNYEQILPKAHVVYFSQIHQSYYADTFFKPYNFEETHQIAHTFAPAPQITIKIWLRKDPILLIHP